MTQTRSYALLVVMLLTIALSGSFLVAGSDPWSQWRGSEVHLGVSSEDIPMEGAYRWSYRTDDQVRSSPVFYNDSVIIGSDDGNLYSLNISTGDLLWTFTTGGAVQSTPLVHEDRVYFGSLDSFFYCIEIPDLGDSEAQVAWSYDCNGSIASSAHVYEDSVIFGCHDGRLYRLSTGGDLVWDSDLGSEIWASPLVDVENNQVFIGCINGEFYCINITTGNVTWNNNYGEIYSSGCLVEGVIYLCGGNDKTFYAMYTDNGSVIWSFYIGHDAYSTPSYENERIYFGSFEYTWCLPEDDPNGDGMINSSEIIWSTATDDFQGGSSPLVADQYVFIGSDDRNLYCFDKLTGDLIWNYTTGGYVYSSPALLNGAVYFGSCDRYVYCIGNRPSGLQMDLELELTEILADETLRINVTVYDQNGSAVEGAVLTFLLSAGEIEVVGEGTDLGDGKAATGPNGRAEILYTPPPVSSRSTIEITILGEDSGQKGETTGYIIVEPSQKASESPGGVIDSGGERAPYILLLMLLVILDIILAVVILNHWIRSKDEASHELPGIERGDSFGR